MLVKPVGKVLTLSVSIRLVIEQLVYLVWEPKSKRHNRTEKALGKKTNSAHTLASLKHVKNVVGLETSTRRRLTALTRDTFHNWVYPPDAQIPTVGVTDSLANSL